MKAISTLRQLAFGPIQAPRTLLLHGFTGVAEDWLGIWPADCAAVAPDLPGHGGSAEPQGDFDRSLRTLLEHLPASVDQVAGYSLGGRLALGLLRLASSRFRRALIISAHPGFADSQQRAERRALDARWIRLLERDGIEAFVAAWERQPLFATQSALPAERLALQRARRLGQRPAGLAASLRVHGLAEMPAMREAIVQYPGELHWMVGVDDRKFRTLAEQVLAWRPSTRLYRIHGAGHNPLLEAPRSLSIQLRQALALPARHR